jgi:hypothetical protein
MLEKLDKKQKKMKDTKESDWKIKEEDEDEIKDGYVVGKCARFLENEMTTNIEVSYYINKSFNIIQMKCIDLLNWKRSKTLKGWILWVLSWMDMLQYGEILCSESKFWMVKKI